MSPELFCNEIMAVRASIIAILAIGFRADFNLVSFAKTLLVRK
jgi:hypothetical protein